MRRREFIAGLGVAAAWPVVARAQQDGRVRRIGVLMSGDENDPEEKLRLSAFMKALGDLGWTDGRNVRMDLRGGRGDPNRIRALAQELVGLKPDIILTDGTVPTTALQGQTRTIPIVSVGALDPVAAVPSPALLASIFLLRMRLAPKFSTTRLSANGFSQDRAPSRVRSSIPGCLSPPFE
jgi:putative ABC transport system substrate-binding protein